MDVAGGARDRGQDARRAVDLPSGSMAPLLVRAAEVSHEIVVEAERMTVDEFVTLVSGITYKPGWKIEARREGDLAVVVLSARLPDSDSKTGAITIVNRHEAVMPEGLQDEKHALWIVAGVMRDFELHEMDEWFRLRGARVNEPHGSER
jgi:hypothetical protein